MKSHRLLMLAVAMLVVAAGVTPWSTARAADEVTLDVRGLDIDNLLQFYSRTFQLTIIKDPSLSGPVTIMCPQPVSRQEALDLLNSVLEVRGFTALLRGSVLKIVPVSKAVQSDVGLHVGRTAPEGGDRVITQMVPLRSAQAAQLQTALSPLISTGASLIADGASNTLTITDYASNVGRLLRIIEQLDSEEASVVRPFPLAYADAEEVVEVITDMFFEQTSQTGASVSGPRPPWQGRLMAAGSTRTGSTTRNQTSTVPVGSIVADTRTNSVFVTTTAERMEIISGVIDALDKEVEYESTLTVIPLERANAQEVADTLNEALGTRRSTTTTSTRSSGTTSSQSTRPSQQTTSRTTSGATRAPAAESEADRAGQAPAEPPAGGNMGMEIAAPPAGDAAGFETGSYRAAVAQAAQVLEMAGNVSVVAEPNTNALIISAPPEYADALARLIERLDQAPPQVLIEAIVAEVSLTADHKLGFEWTWTESRHLSQDDTTGTLSTAFGLASETTGFRYTVAGAGLSTLLHALATDDRVSILSTPRIFTSNNREAEINISTQLPYVSSIRTTDDTETFAVDYLDVGVILHVTPQIAPDGTVTMEVVQEANELLGYEVFSATVKAPRIARRTAEATILVADGQTVILGGIIRDTVTRSVSKVPVLGDLPLLGNLFRHSTVSKEKNELIVFLTPRIVRNQEEAAALSASERERSEAPLPPPEDDTPAADEP